MPLSDKAEMALWNEDVDNNTSVEFLRIPAELFYDLWEAGVWRTISDTCGIQLDDYETSYVPADKLVGVEDALLLKVNISPQFIGSLARLVKNAVLRNRFLVFVL